ncbi:hypothetical protein BFL35_10165 [Clavibacter michiganensis]|nr:hypothetical protein BFL35_10165 [Clavibacter michiganensis]
MPKPLACFVSRPHAVGSAAPVKVSTYATCSVTPVCSCSWSIACWICCSCAGLTASAWSRMDAPPKSTGSVAWAAVGTRAPNRPSASAAPSNLADRGMRLLRRLKGVLHPG